MIPVFLRGETLGKTIYNIVALVALAGLLLFFGWGVLTGKYWQWKADRMETRAENAEAIAGVATANANNANGAASNASTTRGNMDGQTVEVRIHTDDAARRAESYVPNDLDSVDGGVPADIVRELENAHDRARSAADRLQRKGAG
jgi:hypothetical protein